MFSPHDLRYRRISLLHRQGRSWAEIARFVGQRKLSLTADVYTHALIEGADVDYAGGPRSPGAAGRAATISSDMRRVTLKRLTISGLLVTAVVCAYIGMQLSRDCEQRGTTHETAQWFLAIVGGLAVGLATGAGVRIHWILRVVIAVAVTMLAIGALIVLDGLAWVDECD